MISKEAKRIYDIQYRDKHKERLKNLKKVWRQNNKKKLNDWVKKWQKTEKGKETIKKWKTKSPKNLIALYKKSANKRGLSFNISLEIFEYLISQDCVYCGQKSSLKRNGLDRINNKKGYELDNVVSCCFTCNQMKGQLTTIDFLSHIGRIIEYGVK